MKKFEFIVRNSGASRIVEAYADTADEALAKVKNLNLNRGDKTASVTPLDAPKEEKAAKTVKEAKKAK